MWAHQGWLSDNSTFSQIRSIFVCLMGKSRVFFVGSWAVALYLAGCVCRGKWGVGVGWRGSVRDAGEEEGTAFLCIFSQRFIDPRPHPENNKFSCLIKNKQRSGIALKISRTALQPHNLCSHFCYPILQRASSMILVAVWGPMPFFSFLPLCLGPEPSALSHVGWRLKSTPTKWDKNKLCHK